MAKGTGDSSMAEDIALLYKAKSLVLNDNTAVRCDIRCCLDLAAARGMRSCRGKAAFLCACQGKEGRQQLPGDGTVCRKFLTVAAFPCGTQLARSCSNIARMAASSCATSRCEMPHTYLPPTGTSLVHGAVVTASATSSRAARSLRRTRRAFLACRRQPAVATSQH
eukprot:1335619-Pleurochrysis_carterae.AAC.2